MEEKDLRTREDVASEVGEASLDAVNALLQEAASVISDSSEGIAWAGKVLPILISIKFLAQRLNAELLQKVEPLSIAIQDIRTLYCSVLSPLSVIDAKLRSEVLSRYRSTDAIKKEGVGSLVFSPRWAFEVEDSSKVERRFLLPDSNLIKDAIKGGMRRIKGIRVFQTRDLQVRPVRD